MHHAYLIPAYMEKEKLQDFILNLLSLSKDESKFHFFADNNLKIDLARKVKDTLHTKSPLGITRVVCLSFVTMNEVAQNSLLKMIEEPGERTVFFLVTSHGELLLPTIRSRVQELKVDTLDFKKSEALPHSLSDLLLLASKIIEDVKNEKASKDSALVFVDKIIALARHNKKSPATIKRLLELRSYILDQSSSLKQILESAILLAYGI